MVVVERVWVLRKQDGLCDDMVLRCVGNESHCVLPDSVVASPIYHTSLASSHTGWGEFEVASVGLTFIG